jgi:hypothetical protein
MSKNPPSRATAREARYGKRLAQLAEAFRAGHAGPPLRHAAAVGVPPGTVLAAQDWTSLFGKDGVACGSVQPWAEPVSSGETWHMTMVGKGLPCYGPPPYSWPEQPYPAGADSDRPPPWQCCWFTDQAGNDLSPACRHFTDLAAEAERCRCALANVGPADPDHSTFAAESWVQALHRLAWEADHPVLKAPRYRYFTPPSEPGKVLRVPWDAVMDSDGTITAPPLRWNGEILPPLERDPDARPLFPHRFVSIISLDVFQASELACHLLLARPSAVADPAPAGPSVGRKRATVNQRMLEQLQRVPESTGWSQRQWANFLHCQPSAVAKTPAWQTVKSARALGEVDRLDRPRR